MTVRALQSLALSIGASFLATLLLRRLLAVEGAREDSAGGHRVAVVVIPVMAGNHWHIGPQPKRSRPPWKK
jgi:hypothetical protein